MPSPFDQSFYQIRCEWGADGLARLAGAAPDIVVVVDVLRFSTTVTDAVGRGESVTLDEAAHAVSINGAAVAAAASDLRPAPLVLLGCLRNASAVARAVLAEQERRGARTSVAVIAAGELPSTGSGSRDSSASGDGSARGGPRFAVEDLLGAGAIIDALAELGLDHSSPEAATACEAFRGLRRATRHLLAASGSGRELLDRDARAEVLNAAEVDASDAVPILRGGIFDPL